MAIIGQGYVDEIGTDGKQVRRVVVKNDSPIDVSLSVKGQLQNIFNEASAVAVNSSTLINTYTIPIGKKFDFIYAICSGENKAKFTVKINNSIAQVKRTWWATFNCDFNFVELSLSSGDKVEIFVENNGSDAVKFESTIVGGLYDV